MHKRSSKPKTDVNEIAAGIIQSLAGEEDEPVEWEKNPAAVALGRLGGKKGGRARADKLSPEQRKAIAKKAATARWSSRNQG